MRKLTENSYLGIKRLSTLLCLFAKKGGKDTTLFYFLFFLIFLFLFTGMVYGAKEDEIHSYYEKSIPSALISMDSKMGSFAILVEKQTQKLFLYGCVAGRIKLIKSFTCSTGESSGDKKIRGDRRTPEGIYFFTRVFEDEELEPRYGMRALVLDYPNLFDRMQEKEGRGIWLHGTNKALIPNDSKGCIALNNQDLLELSHYISLYHTPIIVLKKIEYLPAEVVEKKKRRLETFIMKWLSSWENKDLSSYMSCYAKDIRSKRMNWEQWKQYKNRLNKKNSQINIALAEIQGFKHNNYDLVTFRQDYHSDILKSKGVKRLFLREDGEELRIIREQWSPLRGGYLFSKDEPLAQTIALKQRDDSKNEAEKIRAFIERWRACWENKELEEYMQCYSDDFKARGMGKQGWKRFKRLLNKRYKNIKVNIIDAEIDINEKGEKAEVSFHQHYRSDSYDDKGLKTLLLKKEKGEWYIVSEKWKPL
ncbi:MAG: hypothetical protein AMJ42_02415 [Deltaproteobacteria bacterium DG_8]|nr:MAG: hypothetical protein AMJ42_02415 [Deltaproteobacteria bacterium DG_8]